MPVQRVREQQRLWSLTDLSCEPLGICPDVDHRDCGAGLQPGDKFEKESGSGLCQWRSHVASVRVAHEDSVRRHASQIKPALFLLAGKHIQKRLAQRWVPIALKGHKPANNVMQRFCRQYSHRGRDGQTGSMQPPDARDFLLGVIDLGGVDALLGLECRIHGFSRDD